MPTGLAQLLQPGGAAHPFNTGPWPTEEEIAQRKELVRQQMLRMRRDNPRLYRRLPLLHELVPPPVPTPEILRERTPAPPGAAPGRIQGIQADPLYQQVNAGRDAAINAVAGVVGFPLSRPGGPIPTGLARMLHDLLRLRALPGKAEQLASGPRIATDWQGIAGMVPGQMWPSDVHTAQRFINAGVAPGKYLGELAEHMSVPGKWDEALTLLNVLKKGP